VSSRVKQEEVLLVVVEISDLHNVGVDGSRSRAAVSVVDFKQQVRSCDRTRSEMLKLLTGKAAVFL